jgi:nicotinamidase-related amidase
MLDYYITLVEDCCTTTYGPEAHDEAVALVKKHYGLIASSAEIGEIWSRKSLSNDLRT